MADRMVRVVWAEPRRRIGFGVALAGLFAAAVLFTVTLSTGLRLRRRRSGQRRGPKASGDRRQGQRADRQDDGGREVRPARDGRPRRRQRHARAEAAGRRQGGTIGSVLDLVGVKNINEAQQAALQSRLHIPLIFSLDVIHGYKTMFPVPLGEAATWDPAHGPEATSRYRPGGDAPTGSSGPSTRWSTSAATPAGAASSRARARIRSSARRSPPPRSAATRATTSARPTRWPRPSSTSPPTAPRSPAANTTRSTCRPSSCSTTTCRRTRRRSTPARRP